MNNLFFLLITVLSSTMMWGQTNTRLVEYSIAPRDIDEDGFIYKRIKLEQGVDATFALEQVVADPIASRDSKLTTANQFEIQSFETIERKQRYALLRIPAYVQEANQVKQLRSFRVSMHMTPRERVTQERPTDVTESVLAAGNWYKIAVDKKGIYKIDHAMLVSMGLNPATINPANIRLYGNGGTVLNEVVNDDYVSDLVENSIYVSSTGSTFGPGDYILFYANGPFDWRLNTTGTSFVHTPNYYEDKSYYFLTVDKGPGKRIESLSATGAADVTLTSFDDYYVVDVDSFNPGTQGKIWYGHRMSTTGTSTRVHNIPVNMGELDGPVKMEAVAGAVLAGGGGSLSFAINETTVSNVTFSELNVSGHQLIDVESTTATFPPSTTAFNVKITFNPSGSSGNAYLDYLRFNARRKLTMGTQPQLSFREIASALLPETQTIGYQLGGATANTKIWEVTDALNPVQMIGNLSGSNYTISRPGGTLREFIAFNGSSFLIPTFVEKVENQNLHGMPEVDLLIITRQDFVGQANELAEYHRENDGMKVAVVTVDKIYNEFSSGGQDIAGIRNFIKMFYDRASTEADMIKHVLFFGAASYDYKDRIAANTNIVPVYQTLENTYGTSSYSTDDFYSLMDHGEVLGSSTFALDISVGRIPVFTPEQAQAAVEKIKSYVHNVSFGPWKNNIMFMSDDYDGIAHSADAESISNIIAGTSPNYNHIKLYGDVYPVVNTPSGKRMVAANKAMNDQVFLGTLFMNYSGHGSPTRLAAEDLLTIEDINNWRNVNKLPVIVTATCDFGRFDNPQSVSGGALAFLKPDGGAIASVTTTQLVFASSNLIFNTDYSEAQFTRKADGQWRTLGEALRDGKNKTGRASHNNSKYTLLGDPALTLALPKYSVSTDSLLINENGNFIPSDTFKALGRYLLKGSVRDNDGNVLSNFNGNVYVTIFDKVQIVPVEGVPGLPSYKSQNSVIYKGQATVSDGLFSISFVVPKDINFDFGMGKISYYAENGEVDAAGADVRMTVGGYSAYAGNDNEPPIVQAFIDNDKFRDGGVTGPDPLLFVKLSDENGINVTGSSVGHDLVAILDGDVSNPFVLNNYYQTAPDDFTQGTVSFRLSGIKPGKHTITVKAWDTYNNSGQGSVNFEVVNKDEGAISEVYNYPNPFSNNTTFVIQHNLNNVKMDVTIQIFNSAGSLVNTIERNIEPTANRTEISWDGQSSQGIALANGLYFYRVQIKSEKGVAASAYQKMVLVR
jgi:hypothetical protein